MSIVYGTGAGISTGWACPKCGSVWAPWMAECSPCNQSLRITSGMTGTITTLCLCGRAFGHESTTDCPGAGTR